MSSEDDWKVVKKGDEYEGKVGELVLLTPGGGILLFPDGQRRDYNRDEIRAVIRIKETP